VGDGVAVFSSAVRDALGEIVGCDGRLRPSVIRSPSPSPAQPRDAVARFGALKGGRRLRRPHPLVMSKTARSTSAPKAASAGLVPT
jgi:hypothetical protein